MAAADAALAAHHPSLRRELYLFALYRVFEASLLALVVFSPAGALIGGMHQPALAQGVAIAYLLLSLGLVAHARRIQGSLLPHVVVGIAIDVLVVMLATHAMPGAGPGIAMMLVFNIAASSLFLSLRWSLAVAGVASLALLAEYVWDRIEQVHAFRPLAEVLMFAAAYFAVAALMHHLGRQMRESQRLADQRGAEAANLAEINELVIRRMRTGVMLVDGGGRVRMANEAAQLLLRDDDDPNDHGMHGQVLGQVAPELAMRLAQWLQDGRQDEASMACGSDGAEVLPRFARLLANSDATLVFLDDTSMLSRRAESITLAAMGRFSASLAHEIRNPLAAISYATQLLEESQDLSTSDRRLLQIIHQQCLRTNGIVESVLGLARRERAKPERLDLLASARHFVDDYRMIVPEDNAQLRVTTDIGRLPIMFDPRHLQQILTALVNNAVRYGHVPGDKPRIAIHVAEEDRVPVVSVLDRGPGIPDAVVSQLFRPFFTTSENGTGLGLYIAHELCRANEATLEYVSVPAGGACFRITLPSQHALLHS
ncbi:MAG TPA: HAMP domain-containing sensor histidine kinase [Luteimonas sp.]|nr:HAMP domain-containing sensor histidine kinase [Luteimonas sp.]HRP71680.1 HAMP domain-containing sensor histidine kinase [Luteimonas sp.]